MRHLAVVIDQMLEAIPTDKADFISELRSIRESVMYSAPEMLRGWWNQCALTLEENLCEYQDGIPLAPRLVNEWEKKVVDIWMDLC